MTPLCGTQLSGSVGFKRLFLLTSLHLNMWLNSCNYLLIDGASQSHRDSCVSASTFCCLSTAPLFKKLIDRRVFGFTAAPKRWARFHGNLTGWPWSTGLGCDQCCWRDLHTAIHTKIYTHSIKNRQWRGFKCTTVWKIPSFITSVSNVYI